MATWRPRWHRPIDGSLVLPPYLAEVSRSLLTAPRCALSAALTTDVTGPALQVAPDRRQCDLRYRRRQAAGNGRFANAPYDRWCHDLMSLGRSGRLVELGLTDGGAREIASGLAYAFGTAAAGKDVWVCESWAHRVVAYGEDKWGLPWSADFLVIRLGWRLQRTADTGSPPSPVAPNSSNSYFVKKPIARA